MVEDFRLGSSSVQRLLRRVIRRCLRFIVTERRRQLGDDGVAAVPALRAGGQPRGDPAPFVDQPIELASWAAFKTMREELRRYLEVFLKYITVVVAYLVALITMTFSFR